MMQRLLFCAINVMYVCASDSLGYLKVCVKTASSQGCDTNGLNCISCTKYQTCAAGIPQGMIVSCVTGNHCADEKLKQCQMKLNCYELNECMQSGIFPDVMVDSKYYVCLSDGDTGFLKYEFTCPNGNFFDQSRKSCIPVDITGSDPPSEPNTATTTTTTSAPTTTTTSAPTTTTTSAPTTTTTSAPTTTTTPAPTTTTTPAPATTTTPAPTTTTTPAPATTTTPASTTTTSAPTTTTTSAPTTTTTQAAPSTPFSCPTAGIFENPTDCKTYYRCSTSGKVFRYTCPGTSYFNEITRRCSLTVTSRCKKLIMA